MVVVMQRDQGRARVRRTTSTQVEGVESSAPDPKPLPSLFFLVEDRNKHTIESVIQGCCILQSVERKVFTRMRSSLRGHAVVLELNIHLTASWVREVLVEYFRW